MSVAVVLDVVDSRGFADQRRLLDGVASRAATVLAAGGCTSVGPTAGDELQAVWSGDDPAPAIAAVARLRLSLLVDPPAEHAVELRTGFGVGAVEDEGAAAAPAQSGTAWWRAREALDRAGEVRNGWPTLRWWCVGADPATVTALVALDALLVRLDGDDQRAALLLLDGALAVEVADALGVDPSSLSRRLHGRGVYGWVRAVEQLVGAS